MHSRFFRLSVVALFVSAATFVVGCKGGPDQSTPKKTAVAFAKAFESGDIDTLRKVCSGTDAQINALKSTSESIAEVRRFDDALAKKFGEDARTMKGTKSEDMEKEVEAAEEKINGDTATLTTKKSGTPMKLKKENGDWKIDLADMPNINAKAGDSDVLKAMSAVYVEATKNVEDGKYKTAAEAQVDLHKKMSEAAMSKMLKK